MSCECTAQHIQAQAQPAHQLVPNVQDEATAITLAVLTEGRVELKRIKNLLRTGIVSVAACAGEHKPEIKDAMAAAMKNAKQAAVQTTVAAKRSLRTGARVARLTSTHGAGMTRGIISGIAAGLQESLEHAGTHIDRSGTMSTSTQDSGRNGTRHHAAA